MLVPSYPLGEEICSNYAVIALFYSIDNFRMPKYALHRLRCFTKDA